MSDYEEICSFCHRTEGVAGKMLKMSDAMCICMDCLQRSTDMINQSPYKDMLNMDPSMFMNFPNDVEFPEMLRADGKLEDKEQTENAEADDADADSEDEKKESGL